MSILYHLSVFAIQLTKLSNTNSYLFARASRFILQPIKNNGDIKRFTGLHSKVGLCRSVLSIVAAEKSINSWNVKCNQKLQVNEVLWKPTNLLSKCLLWQKCIMCFNRFTGSAKVKASASINKIILLV